MADLTDPQVVLDIQITAKAATWPDAEDDIQSISALATEQYEYEAKVLELMAEALAETPGEDQQAVYDAQELKVAEALEFKQSAGAADFQSSYIGAS